MNHIYETVLNHNGDFGKALKTNLFCMSVEQIYGYFTNDPKIGGNQHAEELLVNELKRGIVKDHDLPSVELTVFISNSPCSSIGHNCAKKLKDFVMTCQNVSLIVYVSHLYKVLRESCEKHRHRIDDDFYANTCGLWNLMHQERCKIKPYDQTVWEDLLIKYSGVSEEVKKQLLDDYDKKRDYYDRNGIRIGNNDRSRKEEDGLIGKDLKAIGNQILKQLLEIKDSSLHYKQTWLVCSLTVSGNTFMFAKSDQWDKHAEELLLEELRDLGIKDQKLTITIFMNDTPCSLPSHKCADEMIQYLTEKEVDLTLYVTSLCEANPETCTKENKLTQRTIHPNCIMDEIAHKDGLARLKQLCTVTSPNRDAWQKLFSIMNLSEDDKIIKEFWEKYEKKENDRIEKKEDDVIKKYLDKL